MGGGGGYDFEVLSGKNCGGGTGEELIIIYILNKKRIFIDLIYSSF